jgi:nucleotide-binding universal stress UspA family protein
MKILLVIDATNFSKEQLQFPAFIAKQANVVLTAIFLENPTESYVPPAKYRYLAGGSNVSDERNIETKKVLSNENIEEYKKACIELGLSGNFISARGIPEEETIEASRFADLLLISDNLSFVFSYEEEPTKFAEEVLTHAQCAVLIIPKNRQEINEVFFTSNGSFSSMYAIRQFTYLFPYFRNKKVTLLYVTENEDEATKHKRNIKEYLQHHYTNIEFKVLMCNPSAAILTHISKQKNCMVTFGAYGRNKYSQFVKKSKADNMLNKLDIPVFITHP